MERHQSPTGRIQREQSLPEPGHANRTRCWCSESIHCIQSVLTSGNQVPFAIGNTIRKPFLFMLPFSCESGQAYPTISGYLPDSLTRITDGVAN